MASAPTARTKAVRPLLPTRAIAVSLRPHQWVKCVLVFGALIFSRSLFRLEPALLSLHAFLTFCFASSAVYLLNDLRDLQEDRRHPTKRRRPLAAGEITPATAAVVLLALVAGSLWTAFVIRPAFGGIVALYLALNVAYTLGLKRQVVLDVMLVASGFVLRAVAGAVAIGVPASPWLVLCTLMLALLVGFGKRRHELVLLGEHARRHRASLGEYSVPFLDLMMAITAAAAIVTYALYTMAESTIARFGSQGLVLTVPFVLYGIFRYLFLAQQRSEGGDPSRLFVSDPPTLLNAALWLLVSCGLVYAPAV